MIDLLSRWAIISAILLACGAVTVILWAGLSLVTGSATARPPAPSPTIHAHLLPAHPPTFTLLPIVRQARTPDPAPAELSQERASAQAGV
jgi:hypothetical protein